MTPTDVSRAAEALIHGSGNLTLAEYNAMQAASWLETPFQLAVIGEAQRAGWLVYHTHDSRRSQAGYPDLHLVHPTRGISLFRELKTQKGRTSKDQDIWLAALAAAGHDAAIWRPIQWFNGSITLELYGR